MNINTDKTRQRVKYYIDNNNSKSTLPLDSDNISDNLFYNKKSFDPNLDLNRQLSNKMYITDYDIESNLRKPETCYNIDDQLKTFCKKNGNNKYDDVCTIGKRNYNIDLNNSKNVNYENEILIKDIDDITRDKYLLNCSQRRKTLDWSGYRAPPKQINGQGFGNPNNYHQVRYGLDTRHNNIEQNINVRDVDYKDREMIPIDTFMWNYSGIRYDIDIRSGISSRTYKKTNTDYNI